MRGMKNQIESLVLLAWLTVMGVTSVCAAPQHASAPAHHGDNSKPDGPKSSGAEKPTATGAHHASAAIELEAPPIPPSEPAGANAKSKPAVPQDQRAAASAESQVAPPTADEALAMLVAGNTRWVADSCANPHDEISRRALLAENGQHPFATILTCSDSRLPAERIFDCGVGDLFVIRVAGNVMGESEIGTIEYGLEHLHTPLLVVMGHSKCGAVGAAVSDAHVEGSIATLIKHIEPAVERAERLHPEKHGDDIIPEATKENVWQSIFDLLKTSKIARMLAREGHVKIVGAVCEISTGKVEFLGEHPWQSELIGALSDPEICGDVETAAAADNQP